MYYFCLCKSFKELSLSASALVFCAKAGAKVLLFSEPTKLFRGNFRFSCKIPHTLDKHQAEKRNTPYYIYISGRKNDQTQISGKSCPTLQQPVLNSVHTIPTQEWSKPKSLHTIPSREWSEPKSLHTIPSRE